MIQDVSPHGDYTFTDESFLSATEKWQILHDWQGFLLSGFKKLFFTRALYQFITQQCGLRTGQANQELYWTYHFDSEVIRLRVFLLHFVSPGNDQTWLTGSATDLKGALCEEVQRLYTPLDQVLQDLETKHEEMVQVWHDFALNCGFQNTGLPPQYQVSENTRNLLAYAAMIATGQQRPLTGLQAMFPFHRETLLQSVPIEIQ
jgi:hypothetical protein